MSKKKDYEKTKKMLEKYKKKQKFPFCLLIFLIFIIVVGLLFLRKYCLANSEAKIPKQNFGLQFY